MSIKKKLDNLDKMVTQGNIIDAFDKYFHDNVVTHSDSGDRSKNKAQKREWLVKFFQLVQKVDRIELHGQTITGNVSHSKFTFEFTTTWGAKLVWEEIIRRTWKDDVVIDEYYFEGELPKAKTEKPKKKVTKKPAKKTPAKKVVKKAAPKKVVAKAPAKKVVKKAAAPKKPDDLKKIEGIGPKIAQLLTDAGIPTFAKLAAASQTRLKKILADAGNRYKMHNPATWPEQAKLAKAGQWDELKNLQDRLDGGRR